MISGQSNLGDLIEEVPTIRPSIRTYNLLNREHVHTVSQLLDLVPGTVHGWRSSNGDTWPDIETLQTCVKKMLNRARVEPVRMISESAGAFAIRLVQWETWWQAHDTICSHYLDCHVHDNPYEEP